MDEATEIGITNEQGDTQMNNHEDTSGGARPKGKTEQEKHVEFHSELLASVKQLSTDMSHYNICFNELASRVDGAESRVWKTS